MSVWKNEKFWCVVAGVVGPTIIKKILKSVTLGQLRTTYPFVVIEAGVLPVRSCLDVLLVMVLLCLKAYKLFV